MILTKINIQGGNMRRKIVVLAFIMILLTSNVIMAAETENLSGYGIATSDSYDGENSLAVTAIDGDVLDGSRWIPFVNVKLDEETGLYANRSGKTSWLQIEFEIQTEISHAQVYWATERAAMGHYALQYSNDGENWTEVSNAKYDRIDGVGSALKPYIDTINFDSVKAKFFRVECSAGETEDGLGSIFEFELYGDPNQYDYIGNNAESEEPAIQEEPQSNKSLIIAIVVAAVIVVAIIFVFVLKNKNGGGKID